MCWAADSAAYSMTSFRRPQIPDPTMLHSVMRCIGLVIILAALGARGAAGSNLPSSITTTQAGHMQLSPGNQTGGMVLAPGIRVLGDTQALQGTLDITIDAQGQAHIQTSASTKLFINKVDFDNVVGYENRLASLERSVQGRVPSITTATSALITGIEKRQSAFTGVAYAPNNRIYFTPGTADHIMVVNPEDNTVDTTTYGGLGITSGLQWFGNPVVVESVGRIFFIPFAATSVMILDYNTGALDNTTISGLSNAGWTGGVYSQGYVYGIPGTGTKILAINAETLAYDMESAWLSVSGGIQGDTKWAGGVAADMSYGGKVYAMPSSTNTILIIDPASNTTSTVSAPRTFHGGVYANGKIFAAPDALDHALVVHLSTSGTITSVDTTSFQGYTTACCKWRYGVRGHDGQIYFAPYAMDYVLVIDPITFQQRQIPTPNQIGAGSSYWALAQAANGMIYAAPKHADHILVLH